MEVKDIAIQYNGFQQEIGEGREAFDRIPLLFASSLRKIANGVELVAERAGLEAQLRDVQAMAGLWDIKVQEIE